MSERAHPLIATTVAEDYVVESLLAEGGMGSVFAVHQRSTGRRRALKLMHPALARDAHTRERFVREARVASTIESDHVVAVLDAGFDPSSGAPFLVMELLDGQDLARHVHAHGALSVREAREVLRQLCHALSAAHAAGVIHRDLKPENVFVARSRRADVPFTIKLLDFGIAAVLDPSATNHATGAIVGSPAWMAPEQVDTGLIRASTDVWALGLIAFWLLTAKQYWKSANAPGATMQALLVEKLVDPLERASERARRIGAPIELSLSFDEWFARCVCREPAGRYRDASEAWAALSSILDDSAIAIHATQPLAASISATVAAAPSYPGELTPQWHSAGPSLAARTEPVAGSRARRSTLTAALLATGLVLVAGVSSAAWLAHKRALPAGSRAPVGSPLSAPSTRLARAPAEESPLSQHTQSSGPARLQSDRDAAAPVEAPVAAAASRAPRLARRASPERAARTTAPPSAVVAPSAPTAAPTGRPNRCLAYRALEQRAAALVSHAQTIEATEPRVANNERIQAMAMRASVDAQIAQLRAMARGEFASDPEFVAMARESEQCVARLRAGP